MISYRDWIYLNYIIGIFIKFVYKFFKEMGFGCYKVED